MPRINKTLRFMQSLLTPLNRQALISKAGLLSDRAENKTIPAELREKALKLSALYSDLSAPIEAALTELRLIGGRLWSVYSILYEHGGRMKDAAAQMGIGGRVVSNYHAELIQFILDRMEYEGFTVVDGELYRDGEPVKADIIAFKRGVDAWKDGANMRETEGSDKG